MKIVQSLWSKPGRQKADGNRCSWPDKKYNYFSWALSALQFRKYYDQVELITDEQGYDLLINKLELPYTNIKLVLNDLDCYPADLWALGKLYAYGMQEEPFIHADADVYIWGRFNESLENASLLCQNIERGEEYNQWYTGVFFDMLKNFRYYPPVFDKSIARNGSIVSINAGILGGSNMPFFRNYAKEAFLFVDKNIDLLNMVDLKTSNTIFEQFLFYALSEESNEQLQFYNPHFIRYWNDLADFTKVPHENRYLHLIGKSKKDKHIVRSLEYRLQTEYPRYYYRILNLIRTNQI